NQAKPPGWAESWLRWFCNEDDLEIFMGDLQEMFQLRMQRRGKSFAKWAFVYDVATLFRPFFWKKIQPHYSFAMNRHFLKASFRNLRKNKNYSIIHILGLTLGILCSTILFLKIRHELRFDTYHPDADRIYRIVSTVENPFETNYQPGVPFPFREAFITDFPEIETVALIDANISNLIRVPDEEGKDIPYEEDGLVGVTSEYFQLFSYEWLAGNPKTALQEPNQLVITDEAAIKYFGTADAMGKQISLKKGRYWEIVGVVKAPPKHTSFPFQLFKTQDMEDAKEWGMYQWESVSSSVQCYFKLSENITKEAIESRLPAFLAKHMKEDKASRTTMSIQPLADLHFDQQFRIGYGKPTISKASLWALGLIGLVILISACMNFINLNSALIFRRTKEIGVRKVLGSGKKDIIRYFLIETSLLVLISFALAVFLSELIISRISFLLDADLEMNIIRDPQLILFWGILLMGILLMAGLYPAIRMSQLSPFMALKNQFKPKWKQGISLRQGFMVSQFFIAQILIICTLIAHKQMKYFQEAPLGFNKEAVIELRVPDEYDIEDLVAWRSKM
ncbi:MAG: ABC transporter permease, partial [Bacteroidetes bacterium]|nr:ABC transporter permease [Bacteroidota bacterium]